MATMQAIGTFCDSLLDCQAKFLYHLPIFKASINLAQSIPAEAAQVHTHIHKDPSRCE